jgi:tetratricopeptide (TPR) repeat protein
MRFDFTLRSLFVLSLLGSLWRPTPAAADEAEARYRIGLDYKRKGDLTRAIDEIKIAIKLRPEHAAAQLSLGGLLLDTSAHQEALKCFERAIVLSPQHA